MATAKRGSARPKADRFGALSQDAKVQSKESLRQRQQAFERDVDARHRARVKDAQERAKLTRKAYEPLFRTLYGNRGKGPEEAVERMQRAHTRLAKQRLAPPPKPRRVEPGVKLGSLTWTFTPPYDFSLPLESTTGSPSVGVESNSANGNEVISYTTDFNNSSSIDLWSQLGIFFYPPVNGTLQVSVTIGFSFSWQDDCLTDSATNFGQAALVVEQFSYPDGRFEGSIVDEGNVLWSDSSWWSGASGSARSTVTLRAETQVDTAHFYNVWGSLNAQASADGFHSAGPFWFWNSVATGVIHANVSSFVLSLG